MFITNLQKQFEKFVHIFPRIGGKIASINFEENWTTAFCESVSFIFVWRGNKFVIASNKSINTRKITVNGKQIYVDDFNEIKQITLILQKKINTVACFQRTHRSS